MADLVIGRMPFAIRSRSFLVAPDQHLNRMGKRGHVKSPCDEGLNLIDLQVRLWQKDRVRGGAEAQRVMRTRPTTFFDQEEP